MERSKARPGIGANRPLPLEGAMNLRDLGGYPRRGGGRTATGRFLRSEATAALSPGDIGALRSMGLCLVVDLRSPDEAAAAPSRLLGLEGVRYASHPLLDDVQSKGLVGKMPKSMAELYISILDEGRARLRGVFEELAEAEGLRLFNCTAGKDRTGVVAMLLLELAQVDDEAIIADYAASAANMARLFERQAATLRSRGIEVPAYVFESRPGDMRATIDHLRASYGSARSYLAACGLPPSSLDRLERLIAAR